MKTITIEKHCNGKVTVLSFARPEVRNALSWQMVTEFKAALVAIDQDNQCRAVVITGAGESFCAGLDLMDQGNRQSLSEAIGELGDGPRAGMRGQEYMAEMVLLMRAIQQPIIAAVNGHAYGGGLGIALGCDIRMAAKSAKFCTQFIRLGVSGCDIGVSYTLPKLIGAARAHDMMMTARVINVELAEQWGLVTYVVDDMQLQQRAIELAESLCDFSPYGLISTKQGMWSNLDANSLSAAMQLENRNQILNGMGGDVEEAAAAFFEKRKPNYER